jgi:hypothetical protein
MPSYVNIGAYVDEGTMVDTWATVGSCAQIGKNVHLSGGVGIGGVLEPLQANPTIIEDNCFIGARSEVVEGVIVEENSVISMGVYIGQSTRSTTAPPAKSATAACRPARWWSAATCPRTAASLYCAPSSSSGGRPDPRQDQHQRPAARLIAQARTGAVAAPACLEKSRWPRWQTEREEIPMSTMERILRLMSEKASDVYLSANAPALIKINGECIPINNQVLPPDAPRNLLSEIVPAERIEELEETGELNMGVPISGVGRFRISAPCASVAAMPWWFASSRSRCPILNR